MYWYKMPEYDLALQYHGLSERIIFFQFIYKQQKFSHHHSDTTKIRSAFRICSHENVKLQFNWKSGTEKLDLCFNLVFIVNYPAEI